MNHPDPSLRDYEVGPYRDAIAHAALALERAEAALGRGRHLLPADAADVAVGAAIRHLAANGALPALGRRDNPAPARRLPPSHQRARPNPAPPAERTFTSVIVGDPPMTRAQRAEAERVEAARRALGG